jgi:RNA polymerase sigma-70 factor, ECF subfamily
VYYEIRLLHDSSFLIFVEITLGQEVQASRGPALSNETIARLIRKIENGDSSALLAFYESTSRLIFGLILRIVGERASAEEILLDVYTQVWKQEESDISAMAPMDWLIALARTKALAKLQWNKRDNRKQEASGEADPAMTVAPEFQRDARSALESMPSVQRELLEWAYYGGMSCREMAAQIGKPLGAVKSHIRAGLGRLEENLGPAARSEMELE